jgi:C_GCAxxG_C_C family probable redox protein
MEGLDGLAMLMIGPRRAPGSETASEERRSDLASLRWTVPHDASISPLSARRPSRRWALRRERSVSRFAGGYHCSQSVLATYAEAGLSETAALKMGAALAGGSTVGGECGAVAAAYLILGLRHGGTGPVFGDVEKERELFDRIRSFVAEFERRHGAITCRELLGVDVFTPEGLAEGRRRGVFRERCPRYIRDAITILESLDSQPQPESGSL